MQHKNVAKGQTSYFYFTSKDPSNNAELNDIEDSGRGYAIEDGSAASGGVITAGITLTKRTGTGAPTEGLNQIAVDTSNAAYTDGYVYTIFAEGDVVAGGTTGVTAEPIGVLVVAGSITETDVQTACEDAIKAVGLGLYSAITTVTSQTSIILTTGPATNDALNGATLMFRDSNGLIAGFGLVTDYVGATKTVTLQAACPQTLTTNHTATVLPTTQSRGLTLLEKYILIFTVASATSGAAFKVTLVDWWGNAITDSDYVDNALANKALIVDSVQGGSGTSAGDVGRISGATYDSGWDLVLNPSNALVSTPAVGDTGYISLFG